MINIKLVLVNKDSDKSKRSAFKCPTLHIPTVSNNMIKMERILKFRCPKCNVAWKLSSPNWNEVNCNCGKKISKSEIFELNEQLNSFKQKQIDRLNDKNYHSSIVSALRNIPDNKKKDILKTWELSLFPIDLNELKENLNFFDYEPDKVSVYPPKRVELKRYNAYLLRKLTPYLKEEQKNLQELIENQLQIENDLHVLDELLIDIIQNNLQIPNITLTTKHLIEKFRHNILVRELNQNPIIDFASQHFKQTKIRELLLLSKISRESKTETLLNIENELNKVANKV